MRGVDFWTRLSILKRFKKYSNIKYIFWQKLRFNHFSYFADKSANSQLKWLSRKGHHFVHLREPADDLDEEKEEKNVTLFTSGSMLTSMKMEEEGEQGCHQLDDYSYSILEGILPQVIILVYLNKCDWSWHLAGAAIARSIFLVQGPGLSQRAGGDGNKDFGIFQRFLSFFAT